MAFLSSSEQPVSPISSASTADVTAGYDISTIMNFTFDTSFLHDDGAHGKSEIVKHWICVSNLEINATSDSLKSMFYQFCGDEAFTLWENVLIGFVGFENESMLDLAVAKMNGFCSRYQSQPLHVVKASLEDVLAARSACSHSSLSAVVPLLYSGCPVKLVAEAIERRSDSASCAAEIVRESKGAARPFLRRVAAAAAGLEEKWLRLKEFRDSLVRELLRHILDGDSRDYTASCGTLLGELFVIGFLPDDPFHLATRILEQGLSEVAQIDNMCALAHTCEGMEWAISKASFWASIGQMSLCVGDPMRTALRGHLRLFQQNTERLHICHRSPAKTVSLSTTRDDNTPPQQTVESKLRTVYMSHLPPHMTARAFAELLEKCGEVNKVRVCRGNGYSTLFAFVEMTTIEGAEAALRLDGMTVMEYYIRLHIARNPIQSTLSEDATVAANGLVIRQCLFGQRKGTLEDAVSV